ncbi:MAG: biotin-dependent carboxyltransferase family protein [Rhodobacteraceae bacterium]|nr:biotin-dependent carboxyltransferase family protein [Paracoccaceae bacterium]
MSGLEIIRLPPGASIQDYGRPGFRRYGVTEGGAMDRFALAEGQALLANPSHAAALELPLGSAEFRALGDSIAACTGAERLVTVNSENKKLRQTFRLESGDVLKIGAAEHGVYGYLHLPGGIESPVLLNSRSAHEQAELGWKPCVGDRLSAIGGVDAPAGLALAAPDYFSPRVIRCMRGPQSELFCASDLHALGEAEFEVTPARNRVGMRLSSSAGKFSADLGVTLTSDAIVAGDIQVAADGIATVLLMDCQPVGGYPRIATVITADLHRLAQLPTGAKFRLSEVGRTEALAALAELRAEMKALRGRVFQSVREPSALRDLLTYSLVSGVVKGDEQDAD